tara:strand:- start:624 stop:1223 length:600 start_codon:yes stop_codon:yes gene_type:complete
MPNEDIITSLKNAISHGDSLESAKQIMVNSGYNPREVEEASKFVGAGVIKTHQPKPEEQLAMPTQKKGLFGFLKRKKKQEQAPVSKPISQPAHQTTSQIKHLQRQQVSSQQLKQEITSQGNVPRTIQQVNQQPISPKKIQVPSLSQQQSTPPITKQLNKIKPKRPGHAKEIILLIVLLALIGTLITTIVLKDVILGWFS